jgi:hypothetical protein
MKFMTETLVTDTLCYEVIAETAKTLTIRSMARGEQVYTDGAPLPVIGLRAISDPNGDTKVVRLRKDGTYRKAQGYNPLRFTETPIFYTDYKF